MVTFYCGGGDGGDMRAYVCDGGGGDVCVCVCVCTQLRQVTSKHSLTGEIYLQMHTRLSRLSYRQMTVLDKAGLFAAKLQLNRASRVH